MMEREKKKEGRMIYSAAGYREKNHVNFNNATNKLNKNKWEKKLVFDYTGSISS